LNEFESVGSAPCIEASFDFVIFEFRRFMNNHPRRRPSRVLPLIKRETARHHAAHLTSAEKWIVALYLNFVGVVGDELQTGPFRVEDLAATGNKLGSI